MKTHLPKGKPGKPVQGKKRAKFRVHDLKLVGDVWLKKGKYLELNLPLAKRRHVPILEKLWCTRKKRAVVVDTKRRYVDSAFLTPLRLYRRKDGEWVLAAKLWAYSDQVARQLCELWCHEKATRLAKYYPRVDLRPWYSKKSPDKFAKYRFPIQEVPF